MSSSNIFHMFKFRLLWVAMIMTKIPDLRYIRLCYDITATSQQLQASAPMLRTFLKTKECSSSWLQQWYGLKKSLTREVSPI